MEYYLVHSRTKGSKNGVRRFQNPDGTGTPLGLERRRDEYKRSKGSSINANELSKGINSAKDVVNNARSQRANNKRVKEKVTALEEAKTMTDKELQDRLNRLNLENNYVNAISQQSVNNGSDTVDKILYYTGAVLGIAGSAVAIYAAFNGKKK